MADPGPPYTSRSGRQLYASLREFRRRNDYPYGRWTCEEGREVLYNRFYEPIWQRTPGTEPEPADPTEWVPWKAQVWFYDDAHGEREKLARGKAALREWGLPDPYGKRRDD